MEVVERERGRLRESVCRINEENQGRRRKKTRGSYRS